MTRLHRIPDKVSFRLLRWSVVCGILLLASTLSTTRLYAQAGLLEALEKLDKNEDGEIDPSEITPLARPYLERITRGQSRSWREKPISIERLLNIARTYHAARNGAYGYELRPEGESSVKSFSPDREQELVPDFGLAAVKYPYIQADLDLARQVMGSYDLNRDGFIDRFEASRARKWTHRNPFDDDLNKDERISRMELTQRYARRRLLDNMSDEIRQKNERAGTQTRQAYRKPEQSRRGSSDWWRRGGNRYWLTASILGRFDANRNGRLEMNEAQSLGVPSGRIDLDQNGELSREELHAYFSAMQDATGGEMEGLPSWFYERDTNRDQQVSMGEFTTEWTESTLKEFTLLDANGDGLLTAMEVVKSNVAMGGSYVNKNAEALPPRKVIVSEIEINEDFLVGDLNVQVSITHSHADFLDAYLTGPDGQRIELFTAVGGSDDHFDQTIFDDQSGNPIKSAKAPFRGRFQPEGIQNKQPGLSHFNGKSAKGVWQLVIRGTRSDRFGLLNSWALIVQPEGQGVHRDTAPLEAPAPPRPAAERRPSPGASGQSRSSSGGRSSSGQQPNLSKRAEEIRRTWLTMSPEGKRRAKEEMAKRGLHPGGRPMSDAEKQRWKEENSRKQQSERRGSPGEKKNVSGKRPTNKDGRPLSDEEIQRRKDEFVKKKQEKGKFKSGDEKRPERR